MVEQEVEVIAVEATRLLVEAERRSSCQSCSVKSGCGTSVLAKWFDNRHLRFYVDKPSSEASEKISVGDRVWVGLREAALTQGALSVYLIPLLVMIAIALLIESWLPDAFYWRDLIVAASALAGLCLALVMVRFYLNTGRARQNFNPVLLLPYEGKTPSEKSERTC
ncbi:MAG: SoxR reducing system RseC family protein [Gammaproteobacteria bacterium]|nr:SoxR reducing system RseC family protein [Gammaproteobacteria bacterium]